jgi:PAS domain S-box-containing protein
MRITIPIWAWLRKNVTNRGLGNFTAALIIVGIIGLELTALVVMKKMDALKSGRYDNSILTVSQLEVEFQRFLLATHNAVDAPLASRPNAIAAVVNSFDIYFSRISIVSARINYFRIEDKNRPSLRLGVSKIEAHLRELAPLVDNSAGQNADYFRRLLAEAELILPVLRQNAMDTLDGIVRNDTTEFSNRVLVLKWLMVLTQGAAILLGGIAVFVLRQSSLLTRRTVDFARISANLTKAIEASLDAVIITDVSGRISSFNTAAETMFGRRLAEVKGDLVENLLHRDDRDQRKRRLSGRQIAANLALSANKGRVRLTLQKSDGSDFMAEVAIASDVDVDGKPIFLAFLRDITKLVEADAIQRAARLEAERRAAANARFLAVMSHEMRTPLHGVIAAIDLLGGTTTDAQRRPLRKIARDCAGAALEQIEEVLQLASDDAADVPGVVSTFFPVELAKLIVDQMQSLASANTTLLSLDFDPALSGPMLGNRRAFRSALANLVGNAIKFTKQGTITVRIFPTPDMVGKMRVEVRDTGIGIEPQHLTRIFDDFVTVADLMLGSFGASGLGLGIVRRAVDLMGGTLQLESTFGNGSRFWFDIPQSIAPLIPADRVEAAQDEASVSPLTVLVVDDNVVNRLLLEQMLKRLGHSVELASDGAVAVKVAAQRQFDLILMDINMPEMNGMEATRRIRASGASAKVPIMGVTANAMPQDFARFIAAGMNCTLVKPITSAALAIHLQGLASAPPPAPATAQDNPHPLIAVESLRDMQAVLQRDDFLALVHTALSDANLALISARDAPLDDALATQMHQAAGSVAVIGAHRLYKLLCALEDAIRAGQYMAIATLLDAAIAAKQDTDEWFETPFPLLVGANT